MPLEKLLTRVYDLPSIPKIVQELIVSFSSETVDASGISRKIQSDPVIAAKVLRLANSVRYGAGRAIASLDSAVVVLGVDTLKTLVIASGVTTAFTSIPGLDTRKFWRNSFMVANICKVIAKNTKDLDAEVAFTCGILHNIGVALMYLVYPEEMKKIEETLETGSDRTQAEHHQFGFDNNEVGSCLAQRWRFPDVIVEALAQQGDPLAAQTFSAYAGVIYLAEFINAAADGEVEIDQIMGELPQPLTDKLHVNTFKLFEELLGDWDSEDDIDEILR